MKLIHPPRALLLILLLSCPLRAAENPPAYEPTAAYTQQILEGWTVYVHNSLLDEHKTVGQRALKSLSANLFLVTTVVPDHALIHLRQIPIWLEYHNPKVALACYHPSRRWLQQNGFNPDKANAVEIGNARRFLDPKWVQHQPWMVLHELAHGYHFRVLGPNHPQLKAAHKRALDAGLYNSVLHWRGHKTRHYALTDDKEFFAELSEAYFGVNDFYPFVRGELLELDPDSYRLIESLWLTPQPAPATTQPAPNNN